MANNTQQRNQRQQGTTDNAPQATILAIIDNGRDRKATFIKIGALWEGENGSMTGEIVAEPVAWRDSRLPHRVLISFNDKR